MLVCTAAAVGAAYACLSDPEQRQDYERFGADGPQVRQRRRGGGHHAHGDIDPEDIFNMFFGMQPQRGRTYHYQQPQQRQQQQHQRQGDAGNYAQLLQLMPLLLLFLFSFLGNQAGRNDLPFRLQRTPPEFTFRRETAASGTPYYVQANFDKLYGTRSKVRHTFAGTLRPVSI
jgi:DnaJ family protein B protein 12